MTKAETPTAPPLRLLFWESTVRCNLHCKHCRRLDTDNAAANELSTSEFIDVLDSAGKLGRPIIVFSGGEPLLRDDWKTLAREARSRNLPTALATNGTLIDDPLASRISDADFHRVSISLDGPDATSHDAVRGAAGAFDAALRGAKWLIRRGVRLQINTTVTRPIANRLDEMRDLTKRIGAEALHLFLLVPVGCGVELSETHQLSPQLYERVLRWIASSQNDAELEIRPTCAPHYARVVSEMNLNVRTGGCLGGTAVVFVSHTGEVFPCGYLPVSSGTVRKKPLEEIWRDSEVFNALRDRNRLAGKCGRCEYRFACGGCRARAHAKTGDYLSAEPFCSYIPK